MVQLQRLDGAVTGRKNILFRFLAGLLAVACIASTLAGVTAAGEKSKAKVKKKSTEHPLTKPLQLIRKSQKTLEGIRDYTATFTKKERVGRGGRKMISQTMKMKFREKPFSVYFFFQDKATRGREVIYFSGRNNGKLLVHEAGFAAIAGTLSFAPTAGDVMKENRYPITEVGIKNLVDKIIGQWEAETKYDETSVTYYNQARLGTIECMAIESIHPQPRRQFKFHKTRIYLDKKSKLLIRLEQFGWPRRSNKEPPLLEQYTYTNVKTNVGLTDIDFDRRNSRYSF